MSKPTPIPFSVLLPGLALDVVGVILLLAGMFLKRPWLLWSGVALAAIAGVVMFISIRNFQADQGGRR